MARRPRILIVDSRASERVHLQRLLARQHYRVTCAHDAITATRACARFTPDVVLINSENLIEASAPASTAPGFIETIHLRSPACVFVIVLDNDRPPPDVQHDDIWQRTASFLARPITATTARVAVARALEVQQLRRDVARLHDELKLERSVDNPARPPIPGSTLSSLERYAILRTLDHFRGATSRAASMLGISARKIQYKLHEYT